jgi:hypothetical protein
MSEEDTLESDTIPAPIVPPPRPVVTNLNASPKLKMTNISTSPNSISTVTKARSYFVLPTSSENLTRSTTFFRIPKTSPTPPDASPFSRQSDSISETNSVKSAKSTVSFKIDKIDKPRKRLSSTDIVVDEGSEYDGSQDIQSIKSDDFDENEDVFIVKDISNINDNEKCSVKEIVTTDKVAGQIQRPKLRKVNSSDSIPPPKEFKRQHNHHGFDDKDNENYKSEPRDDTNDSVIITVEGKYSM